MEFPLAGRQVLSKIQGQNAKTGKMVLVSTLCMSQQTRPTVLYCINTLRKYSSKGQTTLYNTRENEKGICRSHSEHFNSFSSVGFHLGNNLPLAFLWANQPLTCSCNHLRESF